jgi:Fur family transcriptional regulator, ferric uptake regulator
VKNESGFRFCATDPAGETERVLAALIQAGYSNTRARRAVLAALCEAGGQASSAELLALGRAHHTDLGLVTVYRTLEILLSLGLVRKLHLDEGCHIFALSLAGKHGEARSSDLGDHGHGHHVICRSCGRAVEFEGCDLGSVVTAVEAQTGFRVREHWLEMFGVCPACQGSESANERISESASQRIGE